MSDAELEWRNDVVVAFMRTSSPWALAAADPHPNLSPEASGDAMVKTGFTVVSVSDAFCYSMNGGLGIQWRWYRLRFVSGNFDSIDTRAVRIARHLARRAPRRATVEPRREAGREKYHRSGNAQTEPDHALLRCRRSFDGAILWSHSASRFGSRSARRIHLWKDASKRSSLPGKFVVLGSHYPLTDNKLSSLRMAQRNKMSIVCASLEKPGQGWIGSVAACHSWNTDSD